MPLTGLPKYACFSQPSNSHARWPPSVRFTVAFVCWLRNGACGRTALAATRGAACGVVIIATACGTAWAPAACRMGRALRTTAVRPHCLSANIKIKRRWVDLYKTQQERVHPCALRFLGSPAAAAAVCFAAVRKRAPSTTRPKKQPRWIVQTLSRRRKRRRRPWTFTRRCARR